MSEQRACMRRSRWPALKWPSGTAIRRRLCHSNGIAKPDGASNKVGHESWMSFCAELGFFAAGVAAMLSYAVHEVQPSKRARSKCSLGWVLQPMSNLYRHFVQDEAEQWVCFILVDITVV